MWYMTTKGVLNPFRLMTAACSLMSSEADWLLWFHCLATAAFIWGLSGIASIATSLSNATELRAGPKMEK